MDKLVAEFKKNINAIDGFDVSEGDKIIVAYSRRPGLCRP